MANQSGSIKWVAAICYKWVDTQPFFLLVRTTSGSRWIFPKGKVKNGEKKWAAALREAIEEAGVIGRIHKKRFTTFPYFKNEKETTVIAFLLEVNSLKASEEAFRTPTWFNPFQARVALSQNRPQQHAAALTAVLEKAYDELTT